jgi:hypothetical protein
MKKFFLINAAFILLLAVSGMIAGCSGSFVDPGWAAEMSGFDGGWDVDSSGLDGDDNGGGTGTKPERLPDNASYNDAIDRLDEIIKYCGDSTSLAVTKGTAEGYRDSLTKVDSSGWNTIKSSQINLINALVDTLP